MKHEDFLGEYMKIRTREVETLNNVLQNIPEDTDNNYPSGEYHFENEPCVNAWIDGADEPSYAKVNAVKYPVTESTGILVKPTGWLGSEETYKVGFKGLSFGDIDTILDNLPDF